MQRLSLSSTVIMTLVIFSTVVVVTTVVGIPIQANAKKKMMITTPISPSQSLDGNSDLNDQNTPNISSAQQGVDDNSTNNGNGNSNINNSSFLIYENPTERISMMYPSNWQKIEYPPGAMSYGIGHRIVANFLAPLDSSDNWRGSLTIQISSQSDVKNIIPQNTTATNINLGDRRAFKLEYASNERMYLNRNLTNFNTINLKIMQVWTTIGNNTYLLTYSEEASKYAQYLPVIQKMLSSFKIS